MKNKLNDEPTDCHMLLNNKGKVKKRKQKKKKLQSFVIPECQLRRTGKYIL